LTPLTPPGIDTDEEGDLCPCPCDPTYPFISPDLSPETEPCPLEDAADKLRGGTDGGPIGPPTPLGPSPIAPILGDASTPTFLFAPR
jgi:hypothetical protein